MLSLLSLRLTGGGLKYGLDALKQLLTVEEDCCRLPVVTVEDEPSFSGTGHY
ncbi:hypothetical protein ACFSQ7_26455 [Paenibacillus rhizoplanae]